MIEFSFIEYSFNPASMSRDDVYTCLNKLGFTRNAVSGNDRHSFWRQTNTILMVTETAHVHSGEITGIGFVCDDETVEKLSLSFSESRSMYFMNDPCGLKNYIVPLDYYQRNISKNYKKVSDWRGDSLYLEYISGITYSDSSDELLKHYEQLGFRVTKLGKRYHQLTSSNNRFTIMADTSCQGGKVRNIITETMDAFATTAKCYANGLKTQKFEFDPSELNFGSLNHMIAGYNCKAYGNAESYTIENFVPQPLKNMDLIFRMRKQFIEISEHTLEEYYDECHKEQ